MRLYHSKAMAMRLFSRWNAITTGLWVLVVDWDGEVLGMGRDTDVVNQDVMKKRCGDGLRPKWTAIVSAHLTDNLGDPQGNLCENEHCPLAKRNKPCLQFLPVVGRVPK